MSGVETCTLRPVRHHPPSCMCGEIACREQPRWECEVCGKTMLTFSQAEACEQAHAAENGGTTTTTTSSVSAASERKSRRWGAPPPTKLLTPQLITATARGTKVYKEHEWAVEPDEIGLLLAANSLMLRCAQDFLKVGSSDDPARAAG